MPDRTVLDSSDLVYVYDGSYNGLFTAVFDAVYSRREIADIVTEDRLQLTFNTLFAEVETDFEKARRVREAARKKLGKDGLHRIYLAYLSDGAHKEMAIYRTLMLGFKLGREANSLLTDPSVRTVSLLAQNVSRETDKMMGFMRFSVMEGGAQYCRFSPKNNILPLVLPHFANRLMGIPFVIHDTNHRLLGIYDLKNRYIVSSDGFVPPEKSADEPDFEKLWRLFYDTIGIRERKNTKLMKSLMPARYFRHFWEM